MGMNKFREKQADLTAAEVVVFFLNFFFFRYCVRLHQPFIVPLDQTFSRLSSVTMNVV